MSENMIFCFGDGRYERTGQGYQKNFMAWNKPITEERYGTLLLELKTILSDFKLDAREDRTKEWGKVRDTQWAKIAAIPEFDLEITKKITGLSNIPVEEERTIEIEGKKFTVSELKSLINKS